MTMCCRGVRGATTVEKNDAKSILAGTRELLQEIIGQNSLRQEDVASILFSATPDLTAAFPARAARELGWTHTPLFDCQEIAVPGALPLCIRVLMHWNTAQPQAAIKHVYLGKAQALRPDWTPESVTKEEPGRVT